MKTIQPIHILLVEDNEGDILLTTEALEEGNINHKISVVKDGSEAIDFLNKEKKYETAQTPDLVLLDINLPKVNGHEVLRFIKLSEALKHIPVIMLTTSSFEKDIRDAYDHHANCYITKPLEVENFIDMVSKIEGFWSLIAQLPGNGQ